MHTTMKAAAGGPHRPASPHPRLALIRMVGSDDTVVSVMLEVNRISTKTEQVKLDGSIVGYIT